ncbi:hypothetical protein jhhlp_004034 [Lomentospora prolificans]|uniref:Uncharacterized protein n=1 Tax=Lomentospora prolificans TaxID=41688 RepID=A0A2N3NAF5_9PEZI|nr:hypothetical protein jhhlp_004034 [Lomentospora prolificans]
MSERTLRSPSPHRTTATNTPDEAPPVPSIPDHVAKPHTQQQSPTKRRAVSLQTQPLKLGSEVLKEGHSSWFGPPATDPASMVRSSDAAINTASLRSNSPTSSINFSYPRSSRAMSPNPKTSSAVQAASRMIPHHRPSSPESGRAMVFDPNTRRMVAKSELMARENSYKEPHRKASKKKKKKPTTAAAPLRAPASAAATVEELELEKEPESVHEPQGSAAEGSKFSETGRVSDAPELVTGHMYDDMGAEIMVESSTQTSLAQQIDDPGLQVRHYTADDHGDDGMSATLFPRRNQATEILAPTPQPQAPVVHEIGASLGHRRRPSEILDAVPVQMTASHGIEPPTELPSGERQVKSLPPRATQDRSRETSTSPRISATQPIETLAVPVRHSPPPRSVSPIKPALKQSTSPNRGSNFSDNGSEISWDQGGQVDQAPSRKKSVRVSFDDRNTIVVGESAPPAEEPESPVASPPQPTRKHWYSFGRKRDDTTSVEEADDGEVMKPRPPLPHFGSIRDKKFREIEERPLVRPPSSSSHVPHSGSPTVLPTIPSVSDLKNVGDFSNDHAIGPILANDLEKQNETNISSLREPLPPEVTSVEGDGFISDGSSTGSLRSSDDEDDDSFAEREFQSFTPAIGEAIIAEAMKPSNGHAHASNGPTLALIGEADINQNGTTPELVAPGMQESSAQPIPEIAISQPSPQPRVEPIVPEVPTTPATHASEHDVFFDIPGSFPNEDDSSSTITAKQAPGASPPPSSNASLVPPPTAEEESEDTSIYSDAYEDLSDIEGDGFMSLNAVVDLPIRSSFSPNMTGTPTPTPVKESGNRPARDVAQCHAMSPVIPTPTPSTSAIVTASPPERDIDWEHAKAYWRSLTSEKRRQLEHEALSDAGEEADLDETVVDKKPKRKKSVTENRTLAKSSTTEPLERESSGEERVYQIAPGTKVVDTPQHPPILRSTLRSSLRSSKAHSAAPAKVEPYGRETMRGRQPSEPAHAGIQSEGDAKMGFRKTMRPRNFAQIPENEEMNGHSVKGERPVSVQLAAGSLRAPNKLRSGRRTVSLHENIPTDSPGSWPLVLSQRRGSMDSDSSFRRTTRPRQSEGVGFRKSMRSSGATGSNGLDGDPESSKQRSAFRFRSGSPNGAPPRPPVSAETRIRSTMRRDSSDSSVQSTSHRFRLPSFGRTSKKGSSKASSRLDYSSDDDESVVQPPVRSKPQRVNSDSWVARRFSSSSRASNERSLGSGSAATAGAKGRPLSRGTLREPVAEVSEELSDSTDEASQPKQQPALRSAANGNYLAVADATNGTPRRSRSGRGSIATSHNGSANGAPTKNEAHHRHRHGLMAVLRRKKTDQAARINRPERMDSAARRDTKLERSTSELEALRSYTTTPRQQSNSLGTRSLREGQGFGSRPATAPAFDPDEDSDPPSTPLEGEEPPIALGVSASPGYLRKKPPAMRGLDEDAATPLEPRKKKKFMALRRMFGISD